MSNPTKITIGILAHVDAGKTTLSEQLLFHGGVLRKMGRVDHGDSFLDTDQLEKSRGITIFSKQANLSLGDRQIILLDTPGHVDFSAEMERALSVLDYAILLVSAADGVNPHTQTLWRLLSHHQIPVFVFVNKSDQFSDADGNMEEEKKTELLFSMQEKLSTDILDFSIPVSAREDAFYEALAMQEESLLERFLNEDLKNKKYATTGDIANLIASRKVFPCFFGSALKGYGVEAFVSELTLYLKEKEFPKTFGARVFRISRDAQGQRQVHVRITGGILKVRDEICVGGTGLSSEDSPGGSSGDATEIQQLDETGAESETVVIGTVPSGTVESKTADIKNGDVPSQKVSQIRIYSGGKYETTGEIQAGDVAVLMGLSDIRAGDGLGFEESILDREMVPVLGYRVQSVQQMPDAALLEKLRMMEEESPELSVEYEEEKKEIRICVMGSVQTEVLISRMHDRFGIDIKLDEGEVVYLETIEDVVEGVGHFEPLRHYAEVHLLMEPGGRGSGLIFRSRVSSDVLATNWKRLILQHLSEKKHRGVLTCAPITDMKITLVAGKAHTKHTEGGDFRQATYRAVRQGLMQAKSILLEPYFKLRISVPTALVGRVLTEIEALSGTGQVSVMEQEVSVITGRAPVSTARNFAAQLAAFSGGRGRVEMQFDGYDICHNAQEVIAVKGYEPERDLRNKADSVFCSHGSGVTVPWNEVPLHMHLPFVLKKNADGNAAEWQTNNNGGYKAGSGNANKKGKSSQSTAFYAGEDELKAIFENTYKTSWHGKRDSEQETDGKGRSWNGKAAAGTSGREPQNKETDRRSEVSGQGKDERRAALPKERLLLVDGYNVIFADHELSALARDNYDAARGKLMDMLSDYQGTRSGPLWVVFDAYKVKGGTEHRETFLNIEVVYTKENQTADMFIEKTVHEMRKQYDITVATSDGLEQIVSRGQGARMISSRELLRLMEQTREELRRTHMGGN
ncbi:MAG: NYN domain-containing protein [Lachnospiraceae bacterium]|nr:NYN domain-containing protein [Lachnospiraceae bacterium]